MHAEMSTTDWPQWHFYMFHCWIKQEINSHNAKSNQTPWIPFNMTKKQGEKQMKGRWCAKWVQMCVAFNHYKVTDTFKCSGGERKGLIEQIQRPALLIKLISQLPGVNYHTHTSRCCSTYIIITVAKIKNNLKLMIWGLPPLTCHTHSHTHSIPINIFCLSLLVYSQTPAPSPGASCFWDWFHLFNDGCANDPSHMADSVRDTTTSQEWGLDGDLESEGWGILKRAEWNRGSTTEGWGKQETPCTQAVFVSNKQGQWKPNGN